MKTERLQDVPSRFALTDCLAAGPFVHHAEGCGRSGERERSAVVYWRATRTRFFCLPLETFMPRVGSAAANRPDTPRRLLLSMLDSSPLEPTRPNQEAGCPTLDAAED